MLSYRHSREMRAKHICTINFVAALELMGPRYRTFAGMVICMFFASAMSLLALLVSVSRKKKKKNRKSKVDHTLAVSKKISDKYQNLHYSARDSRYSSMSCRERQLANLAIDSTRGCNADHFASDPSACIIWCEHMQIRVVGRCMLIQ